MRFAIHRSTSPPSDGEVHFLHGNTCHEPRAINFDAMLLLILSRRFGDLSLLARHRQECSVHTLLGVKKLDVCPLGWKCHGVHRICIFHMVQHEEKAFVPLPNTVKTPNMANHNRAATVLGNVSIISRLTLQTIKLAQ